MSKAVLNRAYHLESQVKSGLTVREYCLREKLNLLTFYKWRSRPGRTAHSALPFISVTPPSVDANCVVLFADGTELRVLDNGNGKVISSLISALRTGASSRC